MGSLTSKIHDDISEYEFLCKKFNEIPEKVYSVHHLWLQYKNNTNSNITLDEFKIELQNLKNYKK